MADAARHPRHGPFPGRFMGLGPLPFPGFAARYATVWEPEGGPVVERPVLVVLDGQNVFGGRPTPAGGWELHEACARLDPARTLVPRILAIPHDAARRQEELTPFSIDGAPAHAEHLLAHITFAVLPAFRERYATPPGALGAVLGGSSWGGLCALYGHHRWPEAWGGALCLSPAFWVGGFAFFDWFEQRPRPTFSRIYLDCGGREAEGRMLPPAAEVARRLKARGYPRSQLLWRPDPPADHDESAWRRRLPRALRFMFRRPRAQL